MIKNDSFGAADNKSYKPCFSRLSIFDWSINKLVEWLLSGEFIKKFKYLSGGIQDTQIYWCHLIIHSFCQYKIPCLK